jgi:type IV pilus assembly protein PilQ
MRRTSPRLAHAASLLLSFFLVSTSHSALGATPAPRFVTDMKVTPESEGVTRVAVSFSEPPLYTARLERGGTRLIVDVPNATLKGAPTAITDKVGLVGGVMVQTFKNGKTSTTRLLVTLLEKGEHSVSVEDGSLVIRVARTKAELAQVAPPSSASAPGKAPSLARVGDVRFEHASDEDRVVIELSEGKGYKEHRSRPGVTSIEIANAKLPEELARTLDVSAYKGFLRTISSYPAPGRPDATVIEVEHEEGAVGSVSRRGSALVWTFAPQGKQPATTSATATGVGKDGGAARRTRTVHVEAGVQDLPEVHSGYDGLVEGESAPGEVGAFTPGMAAQQRAFTGRRIDLDLKDADVHNVLRLLADVGQVNIVTADNVSGNVTIRMRNVPWDQALDVVLQSKGLGMVRQGNMIRVAPLAELEKEREMQLARRRQEVRLAPIETRLIPVSYANASNIQERARPMLSERGSIAVDERTNTLIVRDIAGNLNQIEELTRSLDTQTPQVLVEARIVEATSRYIRDVGIQWGGDATFSAATGNPTGLAFPNSVGVAGGASDGNTPTAGLSPFSNTVPNPNFAVNLPAAVGTGSGGALGLTFGSIDNTINLAVRLSAAEATGLLRILSSPRILTLDNHEARISQGTLIPFSQVSAQGVQTTFQEAKLQLLVRPHVTADGSVSMHVKINRDEPDFNQTSARGDPTILKREAETELLVMDGNTAVIGGIYTRNTGRNLDQVPFFGDIPLLGLLFQRRRASDTRGELVIFLTPRIVNRAEALGR